ncbi:TPA: helicase [Staphylococcus aureus]|nr:helicase [Staphylococcus aureus]HCZ7249318.1 helicase [Staphylococcus aureus]
MRGDQRTQGEKSRKEGGKIFGSGSRAPIAISILVKDGSYNHDIYYNDIGEYLTREQKLDTLMKHQSIVNLKSLNVLPDKNNDWINQRDINYENYLPMYDSKDIENSIYLDQFNGVNSARDNWVTNFSNEKALVNARLLVDNYNSEIDRLIDILDSRERINLVNKDETFISWTRGLTQKFSKGKNISINPERIVKFMHRPFTKKWIVYDKNIMEMPSRYYNIMENTGQVIYIQGQGMNKEFSAMITDILPNFQFIGNGKGFATYKGKDSLRLVDNISNSFKKKINLNSEEIVYYIYAILHHKYYVNKYSSDLSKGFPRIPILKDVYGFVEIGRELVELHLNYEKQLNWDGVEIIYNNMNPNYKVEK